MDKQQAADQAATRFTETVTDPTFWQDVLDNACGEMLAGTVILEASFFAQTPERQRRLLGLKLASLRQSLSRHIAPAAAAAFRDWKPNVLPPQWQEPSDAEHACFILPVMFTPPLPETKGEPE